MEKLESSNGHFLGQIAWADGIVQIGRDATGDEEVFVVVGDGRVLGGDSCLGNVHCLSAGQTEECVIKAGGEASQVRLDSDCLGGQPLHR